MQLLLYRRPLPRPMRPTQRQWAGLLTPRPSDGRVTASAGDSRGHVRQMLSVPSAYGAIASAIGRGEPRIGAT